MIRTPLAPGILTATVLAALNLGAARARAQPDGGVVVSETVAPAPAVVTYGQPYKVRYKARKIVVKEQRAGYFAPAARVVSALPVVGPARVVESTVIEPAPVIESRIIEAPPIVETRVIQAAPVLESRRGLLGRTRYYAPYPY